MRLVALMLIVPVLAGCFSFLDDDEDSRTVEPADVGYDPEEVRVAGAVKHELSVLGFANVTLDAVLYEPHSPDILDDGTAPTWPVVVFLHGWGFPKEMWEYLPVPDENPLGLPPTNLLEEFALAGIMAVAYDARGHYQSGGMSTVAGPAEMADLSAVIDHVHSEYPSNGLVGVAGISYGASQALNAWAFDDRVVTAMAAQGWTDLYEGLMPGNVPKLEWAAAELGVGIIATQARLHQDVIGWTQDSVARTNMDDIEAAMDRRSILDEAKYVEKPLFLCQGLQESLLPQVDQARGGGFTRTYIHTGGHGDVDPGCWERALDWARFFLRGVDTEVDTWPELETVDASGGEPRAFENWPEATDVTYSLRAPDLSLAPAGNGTFTIEQRLVSNPLHEPSVAWDQTGLPYQEVPADLRQDPTAVFFSAPPAVESSVLIGAPVLRLEPAMANVTGYQVVGVLYLEEGGDLRVLSKGAIAILDEGDLDDGDAVMQFHFTKADVSPGARIVLKLSANDPTWFMPLLSNYSVEFAEDSRFTVPYFTAD